MMTQDFVSGWMISRSALLFYAMIKIIELAAIKTRQNVQVILCAFKVKNTQK
jgi:hypothetical protein